MGDDDDGVEECDVWACGSPEDEDYSRLVCPRCEQLVYFGDYMSSKKMCVDCWEKQEEPLRPLIDLIEATLRGDICGQA